MGGIVGFIGTAFVIVYFIAQVAAAILEVKKAAEQKAAARKKAAAEQRKAAGIPSGISSGGEVIIRQKPAKSRQRQKIQGQKFPGREFPGREFPGREFPGREMQELVFEHTEEVPKVSAALIRRLPPQGEGSRFDAAPGTFEASSVVAPTIDPSVKPQLESITGIYEQTINPPASSAAASVNIAEWLAKPENIRQAVIMAEIFGQKKW